MRLGVQLAQLARPKPNARYLSSSSSFTEVYKCAGGLGSHLSRLYTFTMTPKIVDMGRDLVKEIKAVKRDDQDSQSLDTKPAWLRMGSQVSGTDLRYGPQLISLSPRSLGRLTPPSRIRITHPPME